MTFQVLIDPAQNDTINTAKQYGKDPREIGEWKVGRKLGAGSNGRVRIARHLKSGKYAAIKIMSKQGLDSESANAEEVARIRGAIIREIVFMKILHHPNILRMYDAFITRGNYYLVLEYVDGCELFTYLSDREETLPLLEALGYFQQVVSALSYCHRFNIAHRDLKPENILLCKDGVVKLADFGLAGWLARTEGMLSTQCGSPHYIAPEVIEGMGVYDGRAADVWSVGIILYSLLTSTVPFHSDDHNEIFRMILKSDITIPQTVDPSARDLLLHMLERDVTRRYTLDDVSRHPFFLLEKSPGQPEQPAFDELAQPLSDELSIDRRIFDNLRYLWPSVSDEVLRASLLCEEKTAEQATYQLLVDYRTRKEDDIKEHAKAAKERRARKMTEQSWREGTHRPTTPAGSVDIPPRADPPTPRRASSGRSPIPSESSKSFELLASYINVESPASSSPGFLLTPNLPNSPRWEQLNSLGIPDVEKFHELCRDPRWSEFFDVVEEHCLNAQTPRLQHMPETIAVETSPLLLRRSRNDKLAPLKLGQRHGLGLKNMREDTEPKAGRAIQRHTSMAAKENDAGADAVATSKRQSTTKRTNGGDEHTPYTTGPRSVRILDEPPERAKLWRHKSEPLEGSLHRRKSTSTATSDSALTSPLSPNWFTGLFKKAPTSEFLSIHDKQVTRRECERILVCLGVLVELTSQDSLGVLKCRINEHQDEAGALIKAMRFSVEVRFATQVQAVGGFNSVATLELEKGAPATFRTFCAKLRQEWSLDVPQLPVYEMSAALEARFPLMEDKARNY